MFPVAAIAAVALMAASTRVVAETFTNPTPIAIPDSGAASPYPSTISPSVGGSVVRVRATLHSISHTNPDDIDVLLVAPNGAKTLLMSDACGGDPITDLTFTFDDAAPNGLPTSQPCVPSGTYRPTDFLSADLDDPFPGPAPPAPYPAAMSALIGAPAADAWNLFVNDDAPVDTGTVAGGWTLDLLTSATGQTCAGKAATQVGTSGADTIVGTPAADVIAALGGNDKVSGLAANDTICGGPGKDTLKGGKGNDKLYGQKGKDTLKGGPGKDKLKGGAGKDKQIQ